MNEEYLPPETETALTVPETTDLQAIPQLIRIRCDGCTREVGHQGTREHAFDLIQRIGWKVGRQIHCPACVQKLARKFLNQYRDEER